MKIYQSPTFFKFIKKVDKKFKAEIDSQVRLIAEKPEIGEQKKGDLQEIRVHKFKFLNCLYLLAYKYIEDEIQLVMLSTHENFYKSLKKYIKR
jgi:mRNA-degrading endonuclease RelE of RelBE toxin-antitoxin system